MDATTRPPRHALWAMLATLDAAALAYVIFFMPGALAAWGIYFTHGEWAPLVNVIVAAAMLFAYGSLTVVGYAIARDIRGDAWRPRWFASLAATLPLLAMVAFAFLLASTEIARALPEPGSMSLMPDRLALLEGLARPHAGGHTPGSILLLCALVAYLGEKYLLRWWKLRWPLSLAAIAILALPVWAARDGEREERKWITEQQWHPLAERVTWIKAVEECKAIGRLWRLPRAGELAIYAASRPEAIAAWKGNAWTSTTTEFLSNAVVLDLTPRYSGTWRSIELPWRDRSLCERDATAPPADWFARLLPAYCATHPSFEGAWVSTVQPIATVGGQQALEGGAIRFIGRETEAAAICTTTEAVGTPRKRRVHSHEEEFGEAPSYLVKVRQECAARRAAAGVCAVFAN